MMTFGVISLLAGVAVLAWPGRTLIVVAVLFGIQLVVTRIFRFVAAFASEDLTGGTRVLLVVLGVLSLVIGLYAVRHVLVTLLALALLLGIYWIINGAVELFMALSARRGAGTGLDRGDGRAQRRGRPAGPGLSRHLPADAGDRAERLAAGARRDGDHPGVPGPVRRAPGRRQATGPSVRRRQCR
jgi:hypothetical protein